MGAGEQRTDGYSDNGYFRMGAAIVVDELCDMAAFKEALCDEGEAKPYLASFFAMFLELPSRLARYFAGFVAFAMQ